MVKEHSKYEVTSVSYLFRILWVSLGVGIRKCYKCKYGSLAAMQVHLAQKLLRDEPKDADLIRTVAS
eukprot:26294-Amphidinium_carterae.1